VERGRLDHATAAALVGVAALLATGPSSAAPPGDAEAQRGLFFARQRNCTKATPLLETAERQFHRPSTAVPLADCYLATGDLVRAASIYRRVAGEKPPVRGWGRPDYNARKAAKQKADDAEARLPTLRFRIAGDYDDLELEVDGATVADPTAELKVAPDVAVSIAARAKGRKDFADRVVLNEGEHRVITVRLAPVGGPKIAPTPAARAASPTSWLGVRYYGVVIPRFLMNLVAGGGTNLVVPGGAFTFTTQAGDAELTFGLGYMSFRMGDTLFLPHGDPGTDWEFVSSTLQAITATVDLMWSFPLDARGTVSFRAGGAVGLGWMGIGDLYRVQAYPANGTYLKCLGPNDPWGTFRYCNGLAGDHYPGYTEPDWFHHGIRPSVFPWLVLPQVGLSFRPSPTIAVDVDTGATVTGFLTSVGMRVGL
jgi:hypothetical protein